MLWIENNSTGNKWLDNIRHSIRSGRNSTWILSHPQWSSGMMPIMGSLVSALCSLGFYLVRFPLSSGRPGWASPVSTWFSVDKWRDVHRLQMWGLGPLGNLGVLQWTVIRMAGSQVFGMYAGSIHENGSYKGTALQRDLFPVWGATMSRALTGCNI